MATTAAFLLLLTIHAVCGQLNYEGNPLTEDTVYTAEESHFAEKTAKARSVEMPVTEDSYLLAARIVQAERAQNLYPGNNDGPKNMARLPSREGVASTAWSSPANSYKTLPNESPKKTPAPANDVVFVTPMPETEYYKTNDPQGQTYPVNVDVPNPQLSKPSESALEMFLNSKTPQESKMALDALIGGQKATETAENSPSSYQPHISDIVLPQQQLISVDPQLKQQLDLQPIGSADQTYFMANQQAVQGRQGPMLVRGPAPSYTRRSYSVRPLYKPGIYRAQSRVGAIPGFRKGPYGSPHGGGSPEIIYTKPPGYGNSLYERGKNPYEDASAWFPDANYPPPDVNVYHSQLYAQSYDPYYYNYIAKYGKIKPHLYGKLPKKEEGFLSELFRSFKKHGMKHMMNPMFLLGLGIPMVTLMLSALVNKRSFARSTSGIGGDVHITDEDIAEWTTKLQKALDCYTESASESERMKCAASD